MDETPSGTACDNTVLNPHLICFRFVGQMSAWRTNGMGTQQFAEGLDLSTATRWQSCREPTFGTRIGKCLQVGRRPLRAHENQRISWRPKCTHRFS
jgi:hypothetical protein